MSLKRLRASSRRGRRAIDRLVRRGALAEDRRVQRQARRLVDDVRSDGDRALVRAVERLDGHPCREAASLRVVPEPQPAQSLPPGFEEALERAIAAVEGFHRRQAEEGGGFELEIDGLSITERCEPLRRVGLYVPGGRFPYPSTVVMSVVPARLAGVPEIVVTTPPAAWQTSAALRHTLHRLGVDEVWTMGGAHAVAALAYGTETVRPVELIAGPGNAWVAAAKELVRGDVGVDRMAGPSELVILASDDAPAEWLAADLLAQAEHDPAAVVVAISAERRLLKAIAAEVSRQLPQLATARTATAALRALSCALLVDDLEQAFELAERIAPEHLQLVGAGAEALAPRVRAAGAIFVGARTPTVFGDYVAGPSHVLPTGGTSRFASGLGVADFRRRWHVVRAHEQAAARLAVDAALLAEVEGLAAHAASARLRSGPVGAPTEEPEP